MACPFYAGNDAEEAGVCKCQPARPAGFGKAAFHGDSHAQIYVFVERGPPVCYTFEGLILSPAET